MEVTDSQKAHLEIYKGEGLDNFRKWKPGLDFKQEGYYTVQLRSDNINHFLNFISSPNTKTMSSLTLIDASYFVDMTKDLIDLSCEFANGDRNISNVEYYRYESEENMPSYMMGNIPSFKSTSCTEAGAEIFKYPTRRRITIEPVGNCPFIPVEELLGFSRLGDEKEILFPPFLDCQIEGDKVKVFVNDANTRDLTPTKEEYMMSVSEIGAVFNRDKANGEISDELRRHCNIIHEYLRNYAITKYNSVKRENSFEQEQIK